VTDDDLFKMLNKADEMNLENWRVYRALYNAELGKLADRIEELEAALRRMLLEFDFLIESGHLPDIRRDIIFEDARVALREKKDGN